MAYVAGTPAERLPVAGPCANTLMATPGDHDGTAPPIGIRTVKRSLLYSYGVDCGALAQCQERSLEKAARAHRRIGVCAGTPDQWVEGRRVRGVQLARSPCAACRAGPCCCRPPWCPSCRRLQLQRREDDPVAARRLGLSFAAKPSLDTTDGPGLRRLRAVCGPQIVTNGPTPTERSTVASPHAFFFAWWAG